jgi:hypothetical protein
MSNNPMPTFETEAVILQLEKEDNKAKCKLKPAAGTSFVEIGATKYVVGRNKLAGPTEPVDAKLWPLDKTGITDKAFNLGDTLEQWALTAWQAQRKVRLLIECDKDMKDGPCTITKITLL